MSTGRILLVDDEPHITRVVATRLQREGFETTEVHDGASGFRAASENPPDLIFVDLQMPCMSGIEMATKLKEQESTSRIPIVMLTARGYMLDDTTLERTNIKSLLSKPFSARELVECAKDLLGVPGSRSEAA